MGKEDSRELAAPEAPAAGPAPGPLVLPLVMAALGLGLLQAFGLRAGWPVPVILVAGPVALAGLWGAMVRETRRERRMRREWTTTARHYERQVLLLRGRLERELARRGEEGPAPKAPELVRPRG